MNPQARLGLFVIIALVLLGLFSSKIGRFQWVEPEGRIIESLFVDASGVAVQTPVLMAGVKVGEVIDIGLENHLARVRMRIHPGISLPASTRARIEGGGLVGEKYVALHATPGDNTPLASSRIPSESVGGVSDFLSRAADLSTSVKQAVAQIESAAALATEILAETRKDIQRAAHGLGDSGEQIAHLVSRHQADLDKTLAQLPETLASGKAFFSQGSLVMKDVRDVILDNRENLYRALFKLRRTAENLEAFSDEIKRNPWMVLKEKPVVPPDKHLQHGDLEEMILSTGRMGPIPPSE